MRILGKLSAVCFVAILCCASASADIRFSANVLWDPDPGDDTQVFLHISNEAYPVPREAAATVFRRCDDPRDYPVLAFIAHHARADIEAVWRYRSRGHSWFDVMVRFGVPPRLLFVELPEPPGPPYGKAYGHWRKRGNGLAAVHVPDADVLFWVNLRTSARYAGVSPAKMLAGGHSAKHFHKMAAKRFRAKHGGAAKAKKEKMAHGRGRGKGKNQ